MLPSQCSFWTLPFCAPFFFFCVLYSIPRASQMDSLWSLRILSPTSYFLESDKTGGFALTSDWTESCSSKPQCKGCLALTSNELDIYTVHSDKSEPIHTEGLHTYRKVKLTNLATLVSWLQRNRLFILMHNGAYYCWTLCFTQKINRKVLRKVCMLLWYVESVECLFCFWTESLNILGNTLQ